MKREITAIFGGTFDPVHLGHVTVARSAGEVIGADKVIFIPAKRSALKPELPIACDKDRVEMIRLAIEGVQSLEVSEWELNRPAPSYTIDTVRHFRQILGDDVKLHWLIGADSIDDLAKWYKIEQLIDDCFISVMYRGGFGKPDFSKFIEPWGHKRVRKLEENVIETPLVDISSTEIRKHLVEGRGITEMLNPKVADYIRQHHLYGT